MERSLSSPQVQSSLLEPLAAAASASCTAVSQSDTLVKDYTSRAGEVEAPTRTTPKKREYPMAHKPFA